MTKQIAAEDVRRHVLENGDVSVAILSVGCATQDWRVSIGGKMRSVVLGYRDPAAYLANSPNHGLIVGRVANRIAGARFAMGGRTYPLIANNGPNTLHGGPVGIGERNWQMEPDGTRALRLTLRSEDGDQGFPGNVDFEVTISLDGHRLRYDMRATTDTVTPVAMAQHNYYNLNGTGDVRDHRIRIAAPLYTPVDDTLIPTGEIRDVTGTRYDFRAPRLLSEADPESEGFDTNLVLDGSGPAAEVTAGGLQLSIDTDQPGIQFYTATYLTRQHEPLAGQDHGRFTGLCLEPQHFPDSVNQPHFPPVWISPDQPYHQRLDVTIAPV
ncbi:aldose epimerase family protein [Shimia biformata]|uniref:aldose epimerase family protein n=1 Tax=Shimia biformata TaxID=1294299 RepID=UPI00194DD1F4|nr:aldose epimerase family protein [Shimia biformata]